MLLKKVWSSIPKNICMAISYTSQYDKIHKCHRPHHKSPIASFKIKVSQIPQDNPHPVFARIHKLVHHMPHGDNYWITLHRIGIDASIPYIGITTINQITMKTLRCNRKRVKTP